MKLCLRHNPESSLQAVLNQLDATYVIDHTSTIDVNDSDIGSSKIREEPAYDHTSDDEINAVRAEPEGNGFDTTPFGPVETTVIHENSIDVPYLSRTVLPEEQEIVYNVITEGSERRREKLI